MGILDILLIVAALAQIIALIVFFVLAANVAKIKKHVSHVPSIKDYLEMAEEEVYIGNSKLAKEYLLRAKYRCEKLGIDCYVPELNIYSSHLLKKIDDKLATL